mmetsp:Transcript_662/g.1640  ORF Transcript_662/g.1640 Transcript_662/m.1640 type:complete len:233 (-) Transcript_662:1225-1923(-)
MRWCPLELGLCPLEPELVLLLVLLAFFASKPRPTLPELLPPLLPWACWRGGFRFFAMPFSTLRSTPFPVAAAVFEMVSHDRFKFECSTSKAFFIATICFSAFFMSVSSCSFLCSSTHASFRFLRSGCSSLFSSRTCARSLSSSNFSKSNSSSFSCSARSFSTTRKSSSFRVLTSIRVASSSLWTKEDDCSLDASAWHFCRSASSSRLAFSTSESAVACHAAITERSHSHRFL